MTIHRYAHVLSAALLITTGAGARLDAQARPVNPHLGMLGDFIRVRVVARGADSTVWMAGRVSVTREGCTYIQLVHGRWVNSRVVVMADSAPERQRVLVPLKNIRELRVVPLGASPADSTAWRSLVLDELLSGEPRGC